MQYALAETNDVIAVIIAIVVSQTVLLSTFAERHLSDATLTSILNPRLHYGNRALTPSLSARACSTQAQRHYKLKSYQQYTSIFLKQIIILNTFNTVHDDLHFNAFYM